MSVELSVCDWDDEEYDDCYKHTIAILKIGHTKIPLCKDCVEELQKLINDFCLPQYCYQCKHFKHSPHGWEYGGSCCKDEEISDSNAGYINCKDCMDSCNEFDYKEK